MVLYAVDRNRTEPSVELSGLPAGDMDSRVDCDDFDDTDIVASHALVDCSRLDGLLVDLG